MTEDTNNTPEDNTTTPQEPVQDNPAKEQESGRLNREAAKYRHQLRETEAERDQLRTQVRGFRQREVSHAMSRRRDGGMAMNPDAATDFVRDLDDETLSDLYSEGALDEDKLGEFTAETLKDKPYLKADPRLIGNPLSRVPLTGGSDPTRGTRTFGEELRDRFDGGM